MGALYGLVGLLAVAGLVFAAAIARRFELFQAIMGGVGMYGRAGRFPVFGHRPRPLESEP